MAGQREAAAAEELRSAAVERSRGEARDRLAEDWAQEKQLLELEQSTGERVVAAQVTRTHAHTHTHTLTRLRTPTHTHAHHACACTLFHAREIHIHFVEHAQTHPACGVA